MKSIHRRPAHPILVQIWCFVVSIMSLGTSISGLDTVKSILDDIEIKSEKDTIVCIISDSPRINFTKLLLVVESQQINDSLQILNLTDDEMNGLSVVSSLNRLATCNFIIEENLISLDESPKNRRLADFKASLLDQQEQFRFTKGINWTLYEKIKE